LTISTGASRPRVADNFRQCQQGYLMIKARLQYESGGLGLAVSGNIAFVQTRWLPYKIVCRSRASINQLGLRFGLHT